MAPVAPRCGYAFSLLVVPRKRDRGLRGCCRNRNTETKNRWLFNHWNLSGLNVPESGWKPHQKFQSLDEKTTKSSMAWMEVSKTVPWPG